MKKSFITLTLIILLIFVGSIVLASDIPKVNPTITLSSNTVIEGGDLTVTLNVKDITFVTGINSINLTIDYDSNVFEAISTTSFDALNNWTAVYEPASKKLSLARASAQGLQTDSADVVKIDFKVKTGTNGKTTIISFKDMVFGDGFSTDYKPQDISTSTITIGSSVIDPIIIEPSPTPSPDPYPQPTPTPTPTPTPNLEPDKPNTIPETGITDTLTYIIGALIVASVIFYINYKRLERKNIRYVNLD